jgi:IS66 Orf2 like protein
MRKSFDSLQAMVREHLELDAFAGHLFVFTSRGKDISSFVAVRRTMSYSCRRAASGSIRDARLAGA